MADETERGFAAMDEDEVRRIASMGGKAAHEKGVAHEFDHREAVEAGRKGGEAVSRDRQHMAEIGKLGGEASHGGRSRGRGGGARRSETKSGYDEEGRGFLEKEIERHVDDQGMPQDQAVAAAMSEARRKGYHVPDRK